MFPDPQPVAESIPMKWFPQEMPLKSVEFAERLNITYSIFADLEPNTADNAVDPFLWAECEFKILRINRLASHISIGTFTGCWDCNQKMTQMEVIPLLFEESFPRTNKFDDFMMFPSEMKLSEQREILLNAQIHYLLLQAMLKKDNVIAPQSRTCYMDNRGRQIITVNADQQKKWKFKLIILWCLLMMLLSNWNISMLNPLASHHTIHIYAGTSDFYLSLIMFAIYIANYKAPGNPLSFEEFHYFYMTNYVFYLKSKGYLIDNPNDATVSNSLTAAIMRDRSCGGNAWASLSPGVGMQRKRENFLQSAQQDIKFLYAGVKRFANACLRPLCLHLYNPAVQHTPYDNYFPPLQRVRDIENYFSAINTGSIQVFVDYLSHEMYWYHFKNITMPQIAHAFSLARIIHGVEAKEVRG
jgi:hypothetical protein